MEVLKVYKGKKAQGLLAHATLGPKSYKSLKLKLSDFIFFEANELRLSKNFGETLDRFHHGPKSAR